MPVHAGVFLPPPLAKYDPFPMVIELKTAKLELQTPFTHRYEHFNPIKQLLLSLFTRITPSHNNNNFTKVTHNKGVKPPSRGDNHLIKVDCDALRGVNIQCFLTVLIH